MNGRSLFSRLPAQRWGYWALWGLALGLPYALAYFTVFSDIELFFRYAQQIVAGAVPYRDVPIEYPPLAAALFVLPRLISGGDIGHYAFAFIVFMGLFDTLQKMLLARYVSRPLTVAWLHTLASTALFYVYLERFDIVAGTFVLLACLSLQQRPTGWRAWCYLALGTSVKLFPMVAAPALWLYGGRQGVPWTRRLQQVAVGAWLGMSTQAAALAVAGKPAWHWLTFNEQRGLHVASTYASLALIPSGFGVHWPIWYDFGSLQVHTSWADRCAAAAPYVTLVLFAITIAVLLRVKNFDSYALWAGATALIAAMMLGNKVYSPQYTMWLIPTAMMAWSADTRRRPWIAVALLVACALTAAVHPGEIYIAQGHAWRSAALLGRNAAVLGLWAVCLRTLRNV